MSPVPLSQVGYNIYLTETDPSPRFSHGLIPVTAIPAQILGTDYGSGDIHPDTRHSGQSRWGTYDTFRKLTVLLKTFQVRTGINLYVLRVGLPSGGYADNEVYPLPFGAYLAGEWVTRLTEGHRYGNDIDIINPAKNQPDLYAQLEKSISDATCQIGRRDFYGNPVTYNGPSSYWLSQDIIHFSCGLSIGMVPNP